MLFSFSNYICCPLSQKWRLGDDDDTSNDDLRNPPFYDPTRASSTFNLLFAALWNLNLTCVTKMGMLAPDDDGSAIAGEE